MDGQTARASFAHPVPPACARPSISHQLPRRIRTGTSGAQNSMRAPAGERSRGASHCCFDDHRDASPKLTTKTGLNRIEVTTRYKAQ